ncbi:MAG: hypothetical protein ABSH05_09305 [Bryobacteraceae bacterium]|jgi:hypothetical protein
MGGLIAILLLVAGCRLARRHQPLERQELNRLRRLCEVERRDSALPFE